MLIDTIFFAALMLVGACNNSRESSPFLFWCGFVGSLFCVFFQ